MAKVTINDETLTGIATAIREKNQTETTYKPSEMAGAIQEIKGGLPKKGFVVNEWSEEGNPIDITITGFDAIPGSYCYAGNNLDSCLGEYLEHVKINEGITLVGAYCFDSCKNLVSVELPNSLKNITNYAFQRCDNLVIDSLPENCTILGQYCFYYCSSISKLTLKASRLSINGGGNFSFCSNLECVAMPNITEVCSIPGKIFSDTKISQGKGYIYVPNELVESFKTATNWSNYADVLKGINIESIEIKSAPVINIKNGGSLSISPIYNGATSELYYKEQEKYTVTVSGSAVINDDYTMLTLDDNAKEGDKIILTMTSTYNPTLTSTKEIEVIDVEPSVSIDLNDGQWVDSGITVDDNIVYKSDAGSYHINGGTSVASITVTGYTNLKLYIRSYAKYDCYTEAFDVDTDAVRKSGEYSTVNNQSATNYTECNYDLDGGTHIIQVMYSKGTSGYSNDDRGYFYIGEVS